MFRKSKLLGTSKTAVKGLILVEAVSALACFGFYVKLNRDPNLRFELHRRPGGYEIVEGYYKLGETLNSELKTREADLELWKSQGKI